MKLLTRAGPPHPACRRAEFRKNMTGFLREAQAGASFLMTSHDEVLAEIRPPSVPGSARRLPGALQGRIRRASDFDVLPPDILAAIEE